MGDVVANTDSPVAPPTTPPPITSPTTSAPIPPTSPTTYPTHTPPTMYPTHPTLPCIQPLVCRLLSPPTVHPLLTLLKPLLPLSLQSHVKPRENSARIILTAVGGNVTRKRTFARSKRKTDACFVFVF